MSGIPYTIIQTYEFERWLAGQELKIQHRILRRLEILREGHLGDCKFFDGLTELRWKNGTRVYGFFNEKVFFILLVGEIKMASKETSKKRSVSKRKSLTVLDPLSSPVLRNKKLTISILLDCIKEGDDETFREVLKIYLKAINKLEFSEEAGIGRRTLYDLLDPQKEFNPEFKTLSALFQALEALDAA